MGAVCQVWFMFVSQPLSVENLCTFQDALGLLPSRDQWQKAPEKFGLRTSASRNGWHQSTLVQIAKGLGIQGLDFLASGYFVCLKRDELGGAAKALDRVVSTVANGIPNLAEYESYDIQELRLPSNRDAFREASPSFDVPYDDSAKSFYSFVKSLQVAVKEAIEQKVYLLYMSPLP